MKGEKKTEDNMGDGGIGCRNRYRRMWRREMTGHRRSRRGGVRGERESEREWVAERRREEASRAIEQ